MAKNRLTHAMWTASALSRWRNHFLLWFLPIQHHSTFITDLFNVPSLTSKTWVGAINTYLHIFLSIRFCGGSFDFHKELYIEALQIQIKPGVTFTMLRGDVTWHARTSFELYTLAVCLQNDKSIFSSHTSSNAYLILDNAQKSKNYYVFVNWGHFAH